MLLVLQAIESWDEKEWLYKRVGSRYLWLSHCKLFRSDLIKNVPRLRNCRSLSQALCTASSHAINICFGKTLAALHWGGHWSLSMGPKGHIHNFLAGYFPPFFKYIFFLKLVNFLHLISVCLGFKILMLSLQTFPFDSFFMYTCAHR